MADPVDKKPEIEEACRAKFPKLQQAYDVR